MVHVRAARTAAGRYVVTEVRITGADVTPEGVRNVPLARIIADLNTGSSTDGQRPRLTRPDGSAPDDFYRLVARAYGTYAAESRAPGKAMAHEAGVPTTTAHRWIREARRRGHLPPGRRGVAG